MSKEELTSLNEIDLLLDDLTAFIRRLRGKRRDHKLTPSQLQALGHLNREGVMTARVLADFERVTPQSIAKTIQILEDERLVSRRSDPSDRRAILITITQLGQTMLREDRIRRTEWLAQVIGTDCTDAERDLLMIAGRILRRLGQDTSDRTDPEESLMNQ